MVKATGRAESNLFRGKRLSCLAPLFLLLTGCHAHHPPLALQNPPIGAGSMKIGPPQNPLFVAGLDQEFIHNQVVDTIDDYFKIQREERVRDAGGVLTEGRVETFPQIGATLLEPWRHDSTAGFEKVHATLQSIRRRALVRIIPADGGNLLDVAVYKELEDVAYPEHATVGGATMRYDSSLVRDQGNQRLAPGSLGWIPQGRDGSLEQRILGELRGRLNVGSAGPLPPTTAELDVNVQLR